MNQNLKNRLISNKIINKLKNIDNKRKEFKLQRSFSNPFDYLKLNWFNNMETFGSSKARGSFSFGKNETSSKSIPFNVEISQIKNNNLKISFQKKLLK